MARRIFKYQIQQLHKFTLLIPKGARILDIDVQKGIPQMWVSVEDDQPEELRMFHLFETGEAIPQEIYRMSDYIGTFQLLGGDIVLHLFEVNI